MKKHQPRKRLLELESLEDRCLLSVNLPVPSVQHGNPPPASTTDILVQFRPRPGASYLGLSLLPGTKVSRQLPLVNGLYEVTLAPGVTVKKALAVYRADRRVLQALPDTLISTIQQSSVPTPSSQLWGLQQIKAPQAWQVTTGSRQVIVAVMDTGIDYNHSDLYDNIWINQAEIPASRLKNLVDVSHDGFISFRDLNNPINQGPGKITDINHNGRIDAGDLLAPMVLDANGQDSGQGGWVDNFTQDGDSQHPNDLIGWNVVSNNNAPLDDNGHGTHVAGIIGASGADSSGVVGVDPVVQLMPVKWMDASNSGSISSYLEGLQYAIAHGATIINNSWITTDSLSVLTTAIKNAQAKGIIFVAAAGNAGTNIDVNPTYPAALGLDNIVAVAASDQNDNLASFSNYGSQNVALTAPGTGIYSTRMGGGFAYDSGTSMATPYVTGVLALVRGLHPLWSYQQVINQVLSTVDHIPALNGKVLTGGRLNAAAAVGWLSSANTSLNFSSGFAGSTGLLTYNGSASITGSRAELTNGGNREAGSVFTSSPVNVTQFKTQFSFQLSPGSSTADGFTFTLQGWDPTALGSAGGGLGYGMNQTGSGGIASSVAVKFDLYNNQGEGGNSTGLYVNGAPPTNAGSIDLTNSGIDLHSGDVFQANLSYDGTTLTVLLTDTKTGKSATQQYAVNIPAQVGANRAYAGFTGGTGGLVSTQDILSWTFSPSASPSGLNYANGFPSTAGLQLNGSAKASGTALQLTDGGNNEAGSVFSATPVNVGGFTTAFDFQLPKASADGFAFVLQSAGATALGSVGGGLGYSGIANSVAVKFDLYNNQGEGSNSTGLYLNGAAPTSAGSVNLTGTGIDLHSGDPFNVVMTYNGTVLQVTFKDKTTGATLTQTYTVNIAAVLGSSTGYVGFTGGTGGLTAIQNILDWTYQPTA